MAEKDKMPVVGGEVADNEMMQLGRARRGKGFSASVRRLGWPFVEGFYNLGLGVRFAILIMLRSGLAFRRPRLIMMNLNYSGVHTLVIILISGLFVGFVLGLQFYTLLERYGQESLVGTGVGLTLFRELGPVTAGLLFVGCACTSITAAIGLKKSSEQIAAMEIMAIDPLARELAPRLWAGIIALPLLTIYFNVMGIFGSYLIVVAQIGLDEGAFWASMESEISFYQDFVRGIYKSIFFGFLTTIIGLYEGYFCVPTAEGVARATTRTVVKGSLSVLGFDFILTAFMLE